MKIATHLVYIFFIASLSIALLIVQQEPEESWPETPEDITIEKFKLGNQDFYIPSVYVDSVGKEAALLDAMYPGSTPLPASPTKLWQVHEWWKNVSIYFKYAADANPSLDWLKETYKTDLVVGEQYGLFHWSQSDPEFAHLDDVWIVSAEKAEYIQCSERERAVDPLSRCTLRFYYNNNYLTVSFDKRLLRAWKIIKQNVLSLYDSFKSPEAAKAYVSQFYPNPISPGGVAP